MEVLVKYENGFRFSATRGEYSVTTGRGDDGNTQRDGMWPAQLFEAAIGMCIGGYIVEYCQQQKIPCDDLTIELSRRIQPANPKVTSTGIKLSRTARIDARIHIGTELSEQHRQGILEIAEYCHITNSFREGMEIICTLT